MTSSQLGHTAKVYGFISTTIYPITTKFDNMVMMLYHDVDVIMNRSRN